MLLVLVSRSLIPAAWTEWRGGDVSPSDEDVDHTSSLGKLGDLLQLRTVISCAERPSRSPVQSSHAAEPGVFRLCATAVGPSADEPALLGATRRGRSPRRAGAPHRRVRGLRFEDNRVASLHAHWKIPLSFQLQGLTLARRDSRIRVIFTCPSVVCPTEQLNPEAVSWGTKRERRQLSLRLFPCIAL